MSEYLQSRKCCRSSWISFHQHYSLLSGTLRQILNTDHIVGMPKTRHDAGVNEKQKKKTAEMWLRKQFSASDFGFVPPRCYVPPPHYCSVLTASLVSAASGSKSHQPPPPPMSGLHGDSIFLPSDRFDAICHTLSTQSRSTKDQQVYPCTYFSQVNSNRSFTFYFCFLQ